MNFLRTFVLCAMAMSVTQLPVWGATPIPPKLTKQVVTIKSIAGDPVGKVELVTQVLNKKTTRKLTVKVADLTLPPGVKLSVSINNTVVGSASIVEEQDNYDVDGDGILNDQDLDDDGDGIPDTVDTDDDDDGIPDTQEDDVDNDGTPDFQDNDDDNDGDLDHEEDNDDDDIPDFIDADADGDGTLDDDEDADDDGVPNILDDDDDNDGIPDDLDGDDDGDGDDDEFDPDHVSYSGKIRIVTQTNVPAAAKGSSITVRLPNGVVIASGKF